MKTPTLRTLIAETRELLEANALAVKELKPYGLALDIVHAYLSDPAKRKDVALFCYWDDTDYADAFKRAPALFAHATKNLGTELSKALVQEVGYMVHGEHDPDNNDGEDYPNNDSTSYWPKEDRDWFRAWEKKAQAVKFTVSELIISPTTGKAGFKITTSPALSTLPPYKGSSKALKKKLP